jgi:hypothetical protein
MTSTNAFVKKLTTKQLIDLGKEAQVIVHEMVEIENDERVDFHRNLMALYAAELRIRQQKAFMPYLKHKTIW